MASGEQDFTKTPGYPVRKRMSARYEGTFAYHTLKDRMPRILTQVVDTFNREEKTVAASHGEEGTEDVKAVISQLSELRYQLQTDKPMDPIKHGSDVKEWASVFNDYCREFNGENPRWFAVSWLFAECFMYRKIMEISRESAYLKDFDPFVSLKDSSFASSLQPIMSIANYLSGLDPRGSSLDTIKIEFEHLVLFSLWGNKMDLSMMASVDNYDTSMTHLSSSTIPPSSSSSTNSPSSSSSSNTYQMQLMRTNLLSDHSHIMWELLCQPKSISGSHRRIDIVLDNAGLELFSDFCFADWLLKAGLADQVLFHFKQMPWFVSDAMIKDFNSMLSMMSASESPVLKHLSKSWQGRVRDGSFVLIDHLFWTTCYEYAAMSNMARDLYLTLCESYLVIFKGDLNYRKLLADRNWLYTESFNIALGGFEPTHVCALRTLKADLVTGLSPGTAAKAATQSKDWMVSGQYAVCQVNKK